MSSIKPYYTYTSTNLNNSDEPYVNSTSEFGYFGSAGTRSTWYSLPTTLLTNNGIATVDASGLRIFKPGIYTLNLSLDPESGGNGNAHNVTLLNFGTTRLVDVLRDNITGSFGGTETNKMFSFGSNSTSYPGIIEWIANGFSNQVTISANISQFGIVNNQLVYQYFSFIFGGTRAGQFGQGICTMEITFIINQDTTIYFNVFCANTITIGRSYFTLELISSILNYYFTPSNSLVNIRELSSDTTGKYVIGVIVGNSGRVYRSIDYGKNFSEVISELFPSTNPYWSCTASSGDGSILFVATGSAGNGSIYKSTDSGATWTQLNNTHGLTPDTNWRSLAISSDGVIVIAGVTAGGIWVSKDSGNNWSSRGSNEGLPAASQYWTGIASSSNGEKLAITASSGIGAGIQKIFTSINFGDTWTENTPTGSWVSIASSSNGEILVATAAGGSVWRSINSATPRTWTQLTNNIPTISSWTDIASSSNGKILIAVTTSAGNKVYFSTNSGENWSVPNGSPTPICYSVSLSSNGGNACVSSSIVYTGVYI